MTKEATEYNFIAWVNWGYDGWIPSGYDTIEDAQKHDSEGREKIITKKEDT